MSYNLIQSAVCTPNPEDIFHGNKTLTSCVENFLKTLTAIWQNILAQINHLQNSNELYSSQNILPDVASSVSRKFSKQFVGVLFPFKNISWIGGTHRILSRIHTSRKSIKNNFGFWKNFPLGMQILPQNNLRS